VLKRYQVLLPDWLEDHIKYYVEKYGISFSEGIRAELCSAILASVPKQYPEYKPGITHDETVKMVTKDAKTKMDKERVHKLLSKVYFEARKAAEYRAKKREEAEKRSG